MNELMKSLVCPGSECFCWILVLVNIFAVFYLVFCSFWKISKLVKLAGWAYSGVLIGSTILILFFHTCIYTLLATVFTGMMLMAILSIILPQQGEPCEKTEKTKASKPMGAYVIFETLDGWFAFGLFDAKRKHLVNSTYVYDSMESAKEAIVSCRENGIIAETEDKTGLWIQEKFIPKFEVCKYGETYGFSLRVNEEDWMIHSKKFSRISACLALLEKVKANIGTTDVYMSIEKISGEGYLKWSDIQDLPMEEIPAVEEPVIPKKCIVGVIWPKSTDPDRVYRYHAPDPNVAVGDFVIAPTLDAYNQKEVIRRGRVAAVEYYTEGEDIPLPEKTIIAVEKQISRPQ